MFRFLGKADVIILEPVTKARVKIRVCGFRLICYGPESGPQAGPWASQ